MLPTPIDQMPRILGIAPLLRIICREASHSHQNRCQNEVMFHAYTTLINTTRWWQRRQISALMRQRHLLSLLGLHRPRSSVCSVSTGDVDGTSSATSNIMSDEMMAANKSTHIATGRARHPQSQGVVERVNAQYKTGLLSWMQEKNNEMGQWRNDTSCSVTHSKQTKDVRYCTVALD